MQEHPLKTLERLDPKLLSLVEETRQLAFSDGALPKKFKLLISLALLAANGDYELQISNDENLDYVLGLAKQSYKKNSQ